MGKIKNLRERYRDHRGKYPENNEDFWEWVAGRDDGGGWTDEQMAQYADDCKRDDMIWTGEE